MGRMYTVRFEGTAVSASQDLFELTPAANKPLTVHALYLSQSSDYGDSEEEGLRVEIIRGHTGSGSGGGTATPRPMNPFDAAAGFTCEVNNTSAATGGSPVTLHSENFNSRVGLVYIPTPECRPKASAAETLLVVRLVSGPIDALTMAGTMYVEEW